MVHETGEEVFQREVSLGSGTGRIEIVNRTGQPLSLDKSWRRVVTFDTRSAANIEPLMHAIEVVLDALREAGIEAFLAYGTLLGAVREGKLLGHDSDADLGYVSHLTHPVDVIRESFRIQRALIGLGYRITRYSALAFKVDVEEGDGVVRGLDVFGGFLMDGHLHLMGEIREPFEESWIFPLGTTTLEGRTFPAPADPDRLLTATYGAVAGARPGVQVRAAGHDGAAAQRLVPRPAGRPGRVGPDLLARAQPAAREPSPFVDWAAEREPDAATYVDLGCGRGSDVLWMAGAGCRSVGLDFQPRSYAAAAAARRCPAARVLDLNLLELRDVLPARRRPDRAPPGTAAADGPAPRRHPQAATRARTSGGWRG